MRRMIVLCLLLSAVGACSRHDEASARQDARSAVADVKAGAHKVASDPNLRKAGAEVKKTAAEAAHAIKATANEAKHAVKSTAHEARRKADEG